MDRRLNSLAWLLGLAGLLPFLGCALGAVGLVYGDPGRAGDFAFALVAYGAVILSFLGAVHWGLAFADATRLIDPDAARRVDRQRLGLGVLPALVGWVALLVTLTMPRGAGPALDAALAILIAGFVATVAFEAQAHRRGLVPSGYLPLRWVLSIVVVAVLTTVLVLRLVGAKIVF